MVTAPRPLSTRLGLDIRAGDFVHSGVPQENLAAGCASGPARRGTIQGVVVGQDGRGVAGVTVTLSGPVAAEVRTDAQGRKGPLLFDLAEQLLPPQERYTHVDRGNSEDLDHILVSKNLLDRGGVPHEIAGCRTCCTPRSWRRMMRSMSGRTYTIS